MKYNFTKYYNKLYKNIYVNIIIFKEKYIKVKQFNST